LTVSPRRPTWPAMFVARQNLGLLPFQLAHRTARVFNTVCACRSGPGGRGRGSIYGGAYDEGTVRGVGGAAPAYLAAMASNSTSALRRARGAAWETEPMACDVCRPGPLKRLNFRDGPVCELQLMPCHDRPFLSSRAIRAAAPRPAEAVRRGPFGVGLWKKVEVTVYLRGAAVCFWGRRATG